MDGDKGTVRYLQPSLHNTPINHVVNACAHHKTELYSVLGCSRLECVNLMCLFNFIKSVSVCMCKHSFVMIHSHSPTEIICSVCFTYGT